MPLGCNVFFRLPVHRLVLLGFFCAELTMHRRACCARAEGVQADRFLFVLCRGALKNALRQS